MEKVTDQFKLFIQKESIDFDLILGVMFHTRKDEGRQFLNMMNNIIDYHLSIQASENNINLQIIHIPACEQWARELFLKFLIHKIAIYHNKTTLERFKLDSSKMIYSNDNLEAKKLIYRKKYLKDIYKKFAKRETIGENKSTNMILIKDTDMNSSKDDKNPWISQYIGSCEEISDIEYNLYVNTEIDAYTLEKKYEVKPFPLENIFVFHTINKVSRSYSRNQLERLNRYGANIKNCFIFSFSQKAFALNSTKQNIKNRLISTYNQKAIIKYNDFSMFVTFSQEESDLLFNRTSNRSLKIIDSPEREFFANEMEVFIDNISSNLKFRNQLTLCSNKKLQYNISNIIQKQVPDFKHEMCDSYYTLLREIWESNIIPTINDFIADSKSIAFIVDKDTPKAVKDLICSIFKKPRTSFRFHQYNDLKKKSGKSLISAKHIIILQYKSPNGMYAIFPNILDPIPLNTDQKALLIVNKLTHNDFYEWDLYLYKTEFNALLYSKFREDKLDWKYLDISKPELNSDVSYLIDEDDSDSMKNYQIKKCKVHFKNHEKDKDIPMLENIIVENNGIYSIEKLEDILEFDNLSIQLLEEIFTPIKFLIDSIIEKNNNAELIVRKEQKFNLTEKEINSSSELWKILLQRKITNLGAKIVYSDLFPNIQEKECISFNAFNQWYNLSSTTILPRSIKDQKAVLSYLGFEIGSVYHRIIKKKKLSSIKGSRKMNALMEKFLVNYLFSDDQEETFIRCNSDFSDFLDFVDVHTYTDFIALKSILKQEILLKPVERFEYDKD